ncbi:hypothetical protein APHAL10511_005265 [Amanita phalloides]|nr:hypothetical protein APHAL10511_005265 [Amanita phalloides]
MDEQYFSSTALADTVLRSSDGVHFYVLIAFLRYVSPIFRDMFLLNTGSAAEHNEIKDGYPVISLSEDSETILCLLRIIYPYIDKPELDDVKLIVKVWKMAEKYGMDTIVGKLEKRLRGDRWTKKQPERVFAISIIVGWERGTLATTSILLALDRIPYCKEFEDISGMDYYRLLEYSFHRDDDSQSEDSNFESEGQAEVNPTSPLPSPVSQPNPPPRLVHPLPGPTLHVREAEEPFHSRAKADIILRTSDAVDFYASLLFLQLVSPTFNNMLCDAKGELKDGLMVVGVADHSRVFRPLLLLIYHCMGEPPTEDLELFGDICMAARKYGLTAMEPRLRRQLAASSEQPLRVYAVATYLGWTDVAKSAARNILNASLQEAVTRVPELMRITGGDLHRLVTYRIMCVEAACKVVKNNASRSYEPGRLAPLIHRCVGAINRRSIQHINSPLLQMNVNDVKKSLEAFP